MPAAYQTTSPTVLRLAADVGYKSVLSSTPYSVDANFVGFEDVFALDAQEEASDAVTAALSFTTVSDLLSVKVGTGAEFSDEGSAFTANATLRLRF